MSNVVRPENGSKIKFIDGKLEIPDNPIIPFIEGDGIGPDIWKATVRVFDAAIFKSYGKDKKITTLSIREIAGDLSVVPLQIETISWCAGHT